MIVSDLLYLRISGSIKTANIHNKMQLLNPLSCGKLKKMMTIDEYDEELEYLGSKYSLLNYAAAVVDVLDGKSLLNKKKIPGFKVIDIEDKCEEIEKIIKKLGVLADNLIIKHFPDISSQLKQHSEAIIKTLNDFQTLKELSVEHPLFLGFEKKARPIQKINQILISWIPGWKDGKNRIQWESLFRLMDWFAVSLDSTTYFPIYKKNSSNKKTLQKLNTRIRQKKESLLRVLELMYGGLNNSLTWKDKPLVNVTVNNIQLTLPINMIQFYSDRIWRFIEVENDTVVLETTIKKDKKPQWRYISKQKMDNKKPILEIGPRVRR